MGVGIGVVFHLVVPGLDMEGRRTVSAGHMGTGRQAEGSVTGHTSNQGQKGKYLRELQGAWARIKKHHKNPTPLPLQASNDESEFDLADRIAVCFPP